MPGTSTSSPRNREQKEEEKDDYKIKAASDVLTYAHSMWKQWGKSWHRTTLFASVSWNCLMPKFKENI